jgi:hypothetical protein
MKSHSFVPCCIAILVLFTAESLTAQEQNPVVPPNAEVKKLAGDFRFTEGWM